MQPSEFRISCLGRRILCGHIMCNKCCEDSYSNQFLISEEKSLSVDFTSPAPTRLWLMAKKEGCKNHRNSVEVDTGAQFILQIRIKQVIFQFELVLGPRQSHPLFTRIKNSIQLCKGYFSLKSISKGGQRNCNTSCKEN